MAQVLDPILRYNLSNWLLIDLSFSMLVQDRLSSKIPCREKFSPIDDNRILDEHVNQIDRIRTKNKKLFKVPGEPADGKINT